MHQRGEAAPLHFLPLSIAEVVRRRAARAGGWPVEEGPAERSEVGGALGGTGPAGPVMGYGT
jgi:hypothetical protein